MKVTSPDRLARLLHDRLAEAGDPGRAVTLARLLDTHLSYPVARAALGMAGKGEYDVALLGLLVDRSLLQVDPAVEAAARRELEGTEPGLGFARSLADRLLRLRRSTDAPESLEGETDVASLVDRLMDEPVETPTDDVDPPGPEAIEPAAEEAADVPVPVQTTPEPSEPISPAPEVEPGETEPASEIPASPAPETDANEPQAEPDPEQSAPSVPAPGPCWSCDAELPDRDGLKYCPHCGSDQEAPRCTACGDRLEPDWSFCPRCGRSLAP
jgi:predicted RNA-binding Zn-ribbon protein involved in translation (DUF1610 family)